MMDQLLLSAVADARGLALDMVESANSGHLGLPMGCAEIGAALFGKLLKFDSSNPTWINRDRFILSAGHGSAFLYTWLYFAGYKITLDDLKNFRKTGSITNGHPEFNKEIGIESTTGPLGQGIGNAVGIALSCKKVAAIFNTPKHKIFDNHVICLCGDGCLQEGISAEACSLAGHWKLDNLIIIFDSNGVTLDADLNKAHSENVVKRFEAYGFEVFKTNGNDLKAFTRTFLSAKNSRKKNPKLIIATTIIGFGIDEVAGTNNAHGASGTKFIENAKRKLGLSREKFFISQNTQKFFERRKLECQTEYLKWSKIFDAWAKNNPQLFDLLSSNHNQNASDLCKMIKSPAKTKISTRAAAGEALRNLASLNKFLITGSADLFSSARNYLKNEGDFSAKNPLGRNIFFGVREHAMGAISNGISYEGVFRMSCSTFLVFSDYMRAAIRMAALSKLGTIFIFTHDSIAVGEDGPTHQPVETLASLRCIPNLDVVRPADYEETVGAWKLALANVDRPTALILSRQDLPILSEIPSTNKQEGVVKGAYIAHHESSTLKLIIISSGSELQLAMQSASLAPGIRIVSMPCMEAFERQPEKYKSKILPLSCRKRISIEAGSTLSWHKYIGECGKIIGVDKFGYSGQSTNLMDDFGISLKNLTNSIESLSQSS